MKQKKSKYDPIRRMCESCRAYCEDKMTLKQVYYRVRGHKNFSLIQQYPDKNLGTKLLWLALDFQTWYGDRDDIVIQSVMSVAYHLKNERDTSSLN